MCLIKEIEIWKDIEGYERLYQVSNMGQVKSLARTIICKDGRKKIVPERILKLRKGGNNDYLYVTLWKNNKGNNRFVHCLVAKCFLEPIEGKDIVNHKDENKQNNHVSNLEFCTQSYNVHYGNGIERNRKAHKGKKASEETRKKMSEQRKGKPKYKIRIPIIQLDLQENFIREWDSATTVSKELNICQQSITKCCKRKQNQCGGYKWVYKSDYKPTYTQLELNFD